MQSKLLQKVSGTLVGNELGEGAPSLTLHTCRRMALTYAGICITVAAAASLTGNGTSTILALGVAIPGAGFLPPLDVGAMLWTVASMAIFAVGLLLWFGTGNVLAPPLAWGGSIVAAILIRSDTSAPIEAAWLLVPVVCALFALASAFKPRLRSPTPAALEQAAGARCEPAPKPRPEEELDPRTTSLLRLLLDRALQPVETFEGFERRDQFQTAALRYQVNFLSYAISMAQRRFLPAYVGVMREAQHRLLLKQQDLRLWRYWALESLWGHLRWSPDPVPRDNIMYTGFVLTQIALAEAALGRSIAAEGHMHLRLRHPGGEVFAYGRDDLARVLAEQYERAPWGLLACEPHWIYPLCNMITAAGLRAVDAQAGSNRWERISSRFLAGLDRDFVTADGRIVPFRSSLTGLALPMAGGAVMQAFPCLFLNAIDPGRASRQWQRLRDDLARADWARAFWPIDVGNYGFSRASSLAASAAAAAEMGDGDSLVAILAMLDRECPSVTLHGIAHRPRASLWAHALELMARCGGKDALSGLIEAPAMANGPHLAEAPYPAVIVTSAVARGAALDLVLRPGASPASVTLRLEGLDPGRAYTTMGGIAAAFKAEMDGAAMLEFVLADRLSFTIHPVV